MHKMRLRLLLVLSMMWMLSSNGQEMNSPQLSQYLADNPQAKGIYLVETPDDVAALEVLNPEQLAFVTQTTLSVDDTQAVIAALQRRFPAIKGPKHDDICYATQNRQDAVKALVGEGIGYLLVVPAFAGYQVGLSAAYLALPFVIIAMVFFTAGIVAVGFLRSRSGFWLSASFLAELLLSSVSVPSALGVLAVFLLLQLLTAVLASSLVAMLRTAAVPAAVADPGCCVCRCRWPRPQSRPPSRIQ